MPRLSIIVPVYNVEKYLAKCLDSIIYPELSDYEIIVVNDGATDSRELDTVLGEKLAPEYLVAGAGRLCQKLRAVLKGEAAANAERNLEIIDAVDDLISYYRAEGLYDKYREQLEFIAFHHAFLSAATRVNIIDAKSPVQDTLLRDPINPRS